MSSLLNNIKNGFNNFTGDWEDVQAYTNVKLTINSPHKGTATLNWANSLRGDVSDSDIIKTIDVCYNTPNTALTFSKDNYARWFKLVYNTSGAGVSANFVESSINVGCLFIQSPNQTKIVDGNNQNTVDIVNTALDIIVTDVSGQFIGDNANALYTHAIDSNGYSLYTVSGNGGRSLGVGLRDNCGARLSTLGHRNEVVNSLIIHTSDVCGHSQAATAPIASATVSGRALFLATDVASIKKSALSTSPLTTEHNALYVNLRNENGLAHGRTRPLQVTSTGSNASVYPFCIRTGINDTLTSLTGIQGGPRLLKTLHMFNDGAVTTWLNVYDVSDVTVNVDEILPTLSMPVPAGQSRDVRIKGGGMHFNNGMIFNSYVVPAGSPLSERVGPGDNVLFISGTWGFGALAIDGEIVSAATSDIVASIGTEVYAS